MIVQKGGQMTKPIIVVKVPCKLLYVIQVKEFLIKCLTSWPYLISELWLLIGLALFLHPRCFCLAYHYFLLEILRKYYEEVVGEVAKISFLTIYNMIVLSFASSLCCCCCCYLPIDFHHRSFRKWHMSFK